MQNQGVQQRASRVILADWHQNMLEGIRSLLETVFDVVVMVADENSLLDSLEKVKPDLVVVDLSLTVTNSDMKVIILSVHDEQTVVDDCISAGVAGFVLKLTAINDLIPAIWEVLKGRTYISPSVETEG